MNDNKSTTPKASNSNSASQNQQKFHQEVEKRLSEMEKISTEENEAQQRRELQTHCQHLLTLGVRAKIAGWVELLETAQRAIANKKNPYDSIAKLIVTEIKQARKSIAADPSYVVRVSEKLQALVPASNVSEAQDNSESFELDGFNGLADFFEEESPQTRPSRQANRMGIGGDLGSNKRENLFDEGKSKAVSVPEEKDELSNLFDEDLFGTQELDLGSGTGNDDSVDEFSDLFSANAFDEPIEERANELSGKDTIGLFGDDFLTEEESIPNTVVSEDEESDEFSNLFDENLSLEDEESDEFSNLFDENLSLEEDLGLDTESPREEQSENRFERGSLDGAPTLYEQFDGLDALLEEPGVQQLKEEFSFEQLEALIDSPWDTAETTQETSGAQETASPLSSEAEFEDLEKLLEQADSSMGGRTKVASVSGKKLQPSRSQKQGNAFDMTMRVPVKQLDNLNNLMGELVVNRNTLEQGQERLRQFLDNLLDRVQQLTDLGGRMQDLYERSLLESSLIASRQHYQSKQRSQPSTEQVGEDYDPLEMDRFSRFHLVSQEMMEVIVRVRESSSDIQFLVDETEQVARTLRQVTTQLQEGMTKSRMVGFDRMADRLPRAVRDISLKQNKQVELLVEGRDVLVDKMIIEHLYDPMTHLVNNAISHGIETPDVRTQQGKPAKGHITIRAFIQGNQTVISVSDDGAGINTFNVKAKALQKGLITKEQAKNMSNQDVYDLLFHPGFSTKDQADDFAGRGVGMDVVHTSLSEIRGTISINSKLGKGTTFTIRLPLTLSICKALCCLSDHARIAFPMDGVEDMRNYSPGEIRTNADGNKCVPWREGLLSFQPLTNLLSHNRKIGRRTVYGSKKEGDDTIAIVVLRSAGRLLAVQVDEMLGEQEIVIKQIVGPVPKPPGIAGATVLGDGQIMPIADVLELIEISEGEMLIDTGSIWSQAPGEAHEEADLSTSEPSVLIVDDSITVP